MLPILPFVILQHSSLHFSTSLKNPKKTKCGDASSDGTIIKPGKDNMPHQEFTLLVAADGVSRAPKDYLASSSTIKLIIEYLLNENTNDLPRAFEEAVLYANEKICQGIEETEGMKSTLSALIYDGINQKIYTINIGDSRIYGYRDSKWNQLSTDDTARMSVKENGKIKTQDGIPIYINALSKCIGGDINLQINVQEIEIGTYFGFALLSDGFYEMDQFETYLHEIYHVSNMKDYFSKNSEQILDQIKDDATLCMLRMPIPSSIQEIDENVLNNYSKAMCVPFYMKTLEKAVILKDHSLILSTITTMVDENSIGVKSEAIMVLNKLIQIGSKEAVQVLTGYIRRM